MDESGGLTLYDWPRHSQKAHTLFLRHYFADIEVRSYLPEGNQTAFLPQESSDRGVVCRPSWEQAVGGDSAPRPPRMTRKHEPCRDCTHMQVLPFLEHLHGLPWYAGQVRFLRTGCSWSNCALRPSTCF